jgi:hypothetical protein
LKRNLNGDARIAPHKDVVLASPKRHVKNE